MTVHVIHVIFLSYFIFNEYILFHFMFLGPLIIRKTVHSHLHWEQSKEGEHLNIFVLVLIFNG